MAKIITLSQKFMKGHPRAGEPTHFVEKVLNSLGVDSNMEERPVLFDYIANLNQDKISKIGSQGFIDWFNNLSFGVTDKKIHTIRAGHRFQTGEKVQLAVWSGKPYSSPQIRICPELEVVTYDFEVLDQSLYIGNFPFSLDIGEIIELSKNDGLSSNDLFDWFQVDKKDFDGQIICWKDPKY